MSNPAETDDFAVSNQPAVTPTPVSTFPAFVRNFSLLFILAIAVMASVHFYRLLALWGGPG